MNPVLRSRRHSYCHSPRGSGMFSLKSSSSTVSLAWGRIHAKTQDVILATLWWVSNSGGAPQWRLCPQGEPGTDVRRPVAPQGASRHRAQRLSDGVGLTIMIVRIDGKDISNGCGDFALLPGDHQLELSAKRLSPRIDTPMIRSGSMTGAPPSPVGATQDEELPVIWASSSPLRVTSPSGWAGSHHRRTSWHRA